MVPGPRELPSEVSRGSTSAQKLMQGLRENLIPHPISIRTSWSVCNTDLLEDPRHTFTHTHITSWPTWSPRKSHRSFIHTGSPSPQPLEMKNAHYKLCWDVLHPGCADTDGCMSTSTILFSLLLTLHDLGETPFRQKGNGCKSPSSRNYLGFSRITPLLLPLPTFKCPLHCLHWAQLGNAGYTSLKVSWWEHLIPSATWLPLAT